MKPAGKTVFRIQGQTGVAEQVWRLSTEGGYHYDVTSLSIGVENWPLNHFVLGVFGDKTFSDPADRGALRRLIGVQVGARANLIRFGKFDQHGIDLLPLAETGFGRGLFHAEGGFNPAPGWDFIVRGGAYFAYSHVAREDDWFSYDVGLGARFDRSFWQDYRDRIIGLEYTMLFDWVEKTPEADDCFKKLVYEKNKLARELQEPAKQRDELRDMVADNKSIKEFITLLLGELRIIHDDIKDYCSKEVPNVGTNFNLSSGIPELPESAFEGMSCDEEIEAVRKSQDEAQILLGNKSAEKSNGPQQTYPQVRVGLAEECKKLRGVLETLLNWPPLECSSIIKPPRFILFPNDNPDIELSWQRRNEVEQREKLRLKNEKESQIFSNPILDEVILYIKKNPDLQIRLIAIANDTSNETTHDKKLAEKRLASVVEYLTLNGLQCEKGNYGKVCQYISHGEDLKKVYYVSSHKKIGGAFRTSREDASLQTGELKREVLSTDDICSIKIGDTLQLGEAYTAQELFQNGELRSEVKGLFPKSVWFVDSKSPVFRSVLIDFIPRGSCPKPLIACDMDEDVPERLSVDEDTPPTQAETCL